jgi:lipoprotein-releasing system permease protein
MGLALQRIIDSIPFVTEALPTITTYPIDYSVTHYLIAVAFALATTWVAGWLPARKAAGLDPVDIIRGK